jgi:hypothetical protein
MKYVCRKTMTRILHHVLTNTYTHIYIYTHSYGASKPLEVQLQQQQQQPQPQPPPQEAKAPSRPAWQQPQQADHRPPDEDKEGEQVVMVAAVVRMGKGWTKNPRRRSTGRRKRSRC